MQDLTVAALQYAIAWKDKRANFATCERLIDPIKKADLIVLPEMFQTGFCFEKEELAEDKEESFTIQWMANMARRNDAVIAGSVMIREDGGVYNRLIWMNPDGSYSEYNKRHLFSMSEEPSHFKAGQQKLLEDIKGWKVCPMICYDLRFPVWIRNVEMYDLLIFVANWPQKRSAHWEKLLQARAIENQAYVIGVNRVGDDGNGVPHDGRSAIIDPLGEPLQMAVNHEAVLQHTLQKDDIRKTRRYMPFLKDADAFKLL